MRFVKWLSIIAPLLLVIACYLTWVVISSKNIVITGVSAEAMGFGKPGYIHLLFSFSFILFTFIPRIWAKRSNLIIAPLNLAWALRNYFMISACGWGECPEKHVGLYLVVAASVLLLVASLFPGFALPKSDQSKI